MEAEYCDECDVPASHVCMHICVCHTSKLHLIFGRPFVKRFTLCCRSVVCLSVTLVHCGQTVGRTKMKLGMRVGLGPGHIVLGGDPAPLPKGAQTPQFSVHKLQSNGCVDQDVTWYGARPQPRQLCVRWGPSLLPKKGRSPLPNFRLRSMAKRLDGSRWHLAWRRALVHATLC